MFNPLQDYIDNEGEYKWVEFNLDDVSLKDPYWLKKIKYRIGSIVMEFNYLERSIDDYILEIMNDRCEDERVWIFLENLSSANKIDALSKLYDNYFAFADFNYEEQLKTRKIKLFQSLNEARIKRNIYIHSNWLGEFSGELVEHKTKKLKSGEYGRIHKRITIADLDNDIKLIISLQGELYCFDEDFFISFNQALDPDLQLP